MSPVHDVSGDPESRPRSSASAQRDGTARRHVWLIARHEIGTRLRQPSFLLGALGLPAVAWLLLGVAAWVNRDAPGLVGGVVRDIAPPRPAGVVDRSGLLETLPGSVPAGRLLAFDDEAGARAAQARRTIIGYFVVPPDVVAGGIVAYVSDDVNALASGDHASWLAWAIRVNLLGGDADLAARVERPITVRERALAPDRPRTDDSPVAFVLPYAITLAFYTTLFGAASHNISALTNEKENRVMEIILTSTQAPRLFAGKIAGLGVLGLAQAALWLGSSFGVADRGVTAFGLAPELHPTPAIVGWGLVYFGLGYLVYASLLAGVGALVPNLREAAQAAFVINSPLLVPLLLMGLIVDDPNGPAALGLSLFPLTAPVVMLTRLAAGDPVPMWQLVLAAALLAVTAAATLRGVAGLFRAQLLLVGQPLTLRRLVRILRASRARRADL
ncbi:hypothetical protein DCC79_13440 [bacterium]|nr:MAG: hypothetical protein DCC79_13440 [bacterium]